MAKGLSPAQSAEIAEKALATLESLPDVRVETAEPPLRQLVEDSGYSAGQVFGIMRMAITGQRVSPPLFETMQILGRDVVLARMKTAVALLKALPSSAD